MKLLVVSEKPAVSQWIAGNVQATWRKADVTFVHLVPFGNVRFNYPRGLKLQDYPRISEPVYKLPECSSWVCPPLVPTSDGQLVRREMSLELFSEADLIVYAGDIGHASAGAFEVIMREVFGDNRALECPALELYSFDKAGLDRTFSNLRPFGEVFAQQQEYDRIKKYFDWNWNVNALAVLGEVQRRVGVPAGAPPLSKYALQLLYALRQEASCTGNEVHSRMKNWPGTGRYQYQKGEWRHTLGSVSSRGQIMDNLVEAGLLVRTCVNDRESFTCSERGHELLGLLHPDCQDQDLPFRLAAWCNQGESAKPGIDRYLKTFFGKQLRFRAG
jgi:hypothetical protein